MIRNWIGVPLLSGGRFIGLISLDKLKPNAFTDNHTKLAEQIATHAALAIQNAQLFQAVQSSAQKLQESQAMLYQAYKAAALGRLATTISHEINNPIQAIQGCLDLTRDEIDHPEKRDQITHYLKIIDEEVQRITTIINQMRQTHPKTVEYAHKPCDINKLLDTIIRDNEHHLKAKKIIMQRKWAEDLPLIPANEPNISQAFKHLIQNIIERMDIGQQLILETALLSDLSKHMTDKIQITIQNSGSLAPHPIQENFFTFPNITDDQQNSLGLFVTYSIIEAHGGQINLTSTAEQGSTFTINLPIPSLPQPTHQPEN
jgi:signal transduction histidine kinase